MLPQLTVDYISGPISGMPDENRRAFSIAEMHLRSLGYNAVNPFSQTEHMPLDSKWRDYMRVLIPVLCRCDQIYMLRGWWHSRGAIVELLIAKVLGIKITFQRRKEK